MSFDIPLSIYLSKFALCRIGRLKGMMLVCLRIIFPPHDTYRKYQASGWVLIGAALQASAQNLAWYVFQVL